MEEDKVFSIFPLSAVKIVPFKNWHLPYGRYFDFVGVAVDVNEHNVFTQLYGQNDDIEFMVLKRK